MRLVAGGERTKTSIACSCQYKDKASIVSEVERSQQHLEMMAKNNVIIDTKEIQLFGSIEDSAAAKSENELQVCDSSRYGSRLTVSTETSSCKCETRKTVTEDTVSHIRVRKARTDRTTRLLIAILCLFLISEFPQVDIIPDDHG